MRMLPSRVAYDLWAESYPATAHNPLMEAEQRVVIERLRGIRATCALDVGSGSGRCVSLLAATGATVTAVDLSMAMLRRNGHSRRVCSDACSLPIASGSVDLVNASLMAGDIEALTPWLAELARVLAPGGQLLYSDFHSSWATRGWQRTFRTPAGEECALPRAPHEISDHTDALIVAGFRVLAVDEIRLPARGRRLLQLLKPRQEPVAVLFHAQ